MCLYEVSLHPLREELDVYHPFNNTSTTRGLPTKPIIRNILDSTKEFHALPQQNKIFLSYDMTAFVCKEETSIFSLMQDSTSDTLTALVCEKYQF